MMLAVDSDEPRGGHAESAICNSTGSAIRPTIQGKPSYHFSVKRPRRNVTKRSIATLPYLKSVQEEKEDTTRTYQDGRDLYRAPRLAFSLLLFVCSAGGYRIFNDLWISRKAVPPAVTVTTHPEEDLTYSLGGLGKNVEHRGSFLLTKPLVVIGEGAMGNTTPTSVEDVPTVLFGEIIENPEQLSNLVTIFHERFNPLRNKIFLWHIPRSGSTTITRIASYCLGLTLAGEAGKSDGNSGINELRIIEDMEGIRFANVDMSHPLGIQRAKVLKVGRNDDIDLISSPYLWDSASVFDGVHQGYMIAMFRHPIERAASLYYSMRKSPLYVTQLADLTSIEEYAKSNLVENNWLTRFLSNTLSGELTPRHEAIAKEVLRAKCLVGLLREKAETIRRFDIIINMKSDVRDRRREAECEEKILFWDWPGKNRHEPVVQGSEAWNILYKQNTFDLRLYEYALQLFEAQGKLF